MKCPECNKEYKDDFKFCPYCGSEVIMKYCTECNFKSYEVNFCPECGVKLLTKDEIVEKAKQLEEDGEYEKTITHWDKLIELNPNNPQYYYEKATVLIDCWWNYDGAIEYYDKAIELAPNNPKYYEDKAFWLKEWGNYVKAIKYYDKAIELDPNNPDLHYGKAYCLKEWGRPSAVYSFIKAMQLDDDYKDEEDIVNYLADHLYEIVYPTIDYLDKEISLDPNNELHYYIKALCLKADCEKKEEELWDKLIELDPTNINYQANKAKCLEKKYEEAKTHYKKALNSEEDGFIGLAINDCKKAIELDPNNETYKNKLQKLEELEIKQNPKKQAKKYYTKVLELEAEGKYEEARKICKEKLQLDTNSADYYEKKAEFLKKIGDYNEAIEYYDKLIEQDPQGVRYYEHKAWCLKELKRYEEAVEWYTKAIELDSTNQRYYEYKALCLMKLGLVDETISCCNNALKLNPKTAECELIIYLEELHCYEEALKFHEIFNRESEWYDSDWYGNKLLCLIGSKRLGEAIEYYEELGKEGIVDWDEDGIEYMHLMAYCSNRFNKYPQEAIGYYERKISSNPEDAENYNGKAVHLKDLEKYEEAIKYYDKAIELEPKEHFYYNKAECLKEWKKYEEAIIIYDNLIKIAPSNEKYCESKAECLKEWKKYEEAIKYYDKAIEILSHNRYGTILRRENEILDHSLAFEVYKNKKGHEWWEREIDYYKNKIYCLEVLGQTEGVLDCLNELIKLDYSKYNDYDKIKYLYSLNHYEEIFQRYNHILEKLPIDKYIVKIELLEKLGRQEEAKKICNEDLKLDTYGAKYYEKKAKCLEELGNYKEAIKYFDKLIKQDPKWARYYGKKANCLEKLGNYNEANENYKKAINFEYDEDYIIDYYGKKANCLEKLGNYNEAILCYDKIMKILSYEIDLYTLWTKGKAYEKKIDCLEKLGRYEEALTNYYTHIENLLYIPYYH